MPSERKTDSNKIHTHIIKIMSRFVVGYSPKWRVGWEAGIAQSRKVYSKEEETVKT